MHITRSQFLRLFAGAGAGALGLGALASCGEVDDKKNPDASATGDGPKPVDAAIDARPIDAPMAGNCMQNGGTPVIGANHGHTMTVPAADIVAGVVKTYQIQGGSLHPHTVTISAAQFTMLQANMPITVVSSNDSAHTHTVTVSCA